MPERKHHMARRNERPATGARENVDDGSATTSSMERGAGQVSRPDKPLPTPVPTPSDQADGASGTGNQSDQDDEGSGA